MKLPSPFTKLLLVLLLTVQPAFAQGRTGVFGGSCSAASIGITGVPDTGDTFQVTISGAPANSFVLLIVGFSNTVFSGNALPMSFAPFGAPGCHLNVSPDLTFGAMTDGNGNASLPIQLPNNPQFDGMVLYAQWLVFQQGANPFGATFTQGIRAVVRAPIVIKDTIGPDNSYTTGRYGVFSTYVPSPGTYGVTPSVATSSVPYVLKSIRVIGYKVTSGDMSCLDYRVRVWSGLPAAVSSPLLGDVADLLYADPSYGPVPFGIAPSQSSDGISYDMMIDTLTSNIQLQPNIPYAFTLTPIRMGSCAWWKNSESNIVQGPSDMFLLNSGAVPAISYPNMTTGVHAVQIVGSALQ